MAMQSGFIKRIRDIMRMDAGINGDAQRIEQMVWMLFLKVYDAKEDDWELNEDNYESIIPEDLRWRNWAKADSNGHAMTGDKLLNFVNNTLFPVLKGNDVKEGDTIVYEGIKVTPATPIKKAIVKSTFEDANNYMKDGVYLRQVVDIIDEIEFDDVKESHAFGFVYEEILRELQSAGSSGEFYTPRAVTEFMAQMIKPKLGEKMADFACGTGGFITSWLGQLSKQVTDTSAQKQLDDSIYGIEKKPFPYLLCVTNMLLHDIEVPNIYHMNSLKHSLLDYTDDDKFDVILMNPPYGGHEDKSIQGFFPDDLASSETADLFMSVILYRLKKNGRAAVVVPDGFLFGLDNAKVNIKKKLIGEFNLHTVVRLPSSVFSPYTSITTNLLFFDNTKPTTETWFYRVDIPSDRKHFSKTKPMELKHFDDCIAWWNNREVIPDGEYFKAQKFTADYLLNEQGCNIDLCGYPHEEEEVLAPADLIQKYEEKRASLNAEIDRTILALSASLNGEPVNFDTQGTINACGKMDDLHKRFPEDMKKSVLQYAIQGKLVEQRPEEGTAEELYRQIQVEKQKLIKAGKIKKEKPLPEIAEDEIPFDIPESWKWVRIGALTYNWGQKTPDSRFCYIDVGSVNNTSHTLNKENTVVEAKDASSRAKKIVKKGDVIFATIRPYLKNICIIDKKFPCEPIASTAFAVMHCPEGLLNKYLYYYLLSPTFMRFANARDKAKGVAYPAIGEKDFFNGIIALPPVAEQKRIVAKLEEILPLCERLK